MTKSRLKELFEEYGVNEPQLLEDLFEELELNTKPLEERKSDFADLLRPYVEEVGRDEVFKFYNYWTQHSPRGRKMKFEMEKTFDVAKRLKTWVSNSKKFSIVGMLNKKSLK